MKDKAVSKLMSHYHFKHRQHPTHIESNKRLARQLIEDDDYVYEVRHSCSAGVNQGSLVPLRPLVMIMKKIIEFLCNYYLCRVVNALYVFMNSAHLIDMIVCALL